MLALSVYIYEAVGHFSQHRRGDRASVDFYAVFSRFGKSAGNNDFPVRLDIHFAELLHRFAPFGNGKFRFHHTFRFAVADHGSVRFRAQNEIDGIEDNGFARARFARKHVQALIELDFRAVDQRYVFNGEFR